MQTDQDEILFDHFPHTFTSEPEELLSIVKRKTEELTARAKLDDVTVLYDNDLYTLVPAELYDENHAADFLKHSVKLVNNDLISTDQIPGKDRAICLYLAYSNINNYFFENFGYFEYYHLTSKLLNYLPRTPQSETADDSEAETESGPIQKMLVLLNGRIGHLHLSIDGKLQCHNSFVYDNEYDVLYYVMFTAAQFGFDPEKFRLQLVQSKENKAVHELLYTYVRHIDTTQEYLKFLQPVVCG